MPSDSRPMACPSRFDQTTDLLTRYFALTISMYFTHSSGPQRRAE